MPHEPTGPRVAVQQVAVKRCPACVCTQPVDNFYTTRGGRLSGYCKPCQRLAARLASRRRGTAIRLLIALHPEEWAGLVALVSGRRQAASHAAPGGGADG